MTRPVSVKKPHGRNNAAVVTAPWSELSIDASRCVKCGRCLSVCPVFRESTREPAGARGKLALIECTASGEVAIASARLKELISFCLLCGACAEICPNLVRGDEIIQRSREALSSRQIFSSPTLVALSHILPFPQRMDNLHKVGQIALSRFLRKIPGESGLYWRFPLSRASKLPLFPQLADKAFLPTRSRQHDPTSGSVAIFVGCVSNYIYPHIAEAVLAVLGHLKISVSIPREQGCCGLIAYGLGKMDVVRRLAKRNIEVFGSTSPGPIVAFCSSCSAHLKSYSTLFADEPWNREALAFSERVQDLSEFLTGVGFCSQSDRGTSAPSYRVTFHDPCHLRRKQGIFEEPRQLLRSLPEVQFIETGKEALCCGSGGSFGLKHYDVSMRIFQRRYRSIEEEAVDIVVTSCMGCLLQFINGIHYYNKAIRVKHLAEIMQESL
ncbi:MAG: (Fe-S)-binding protein [Deltaproteobacteria bacterium]|nr:(Fe-S)-binding protein [Deltaproteobacteria bacterium]